MNKALQYHGHTCFVYKLTGFDAIKLIYPIVKQYNKYIICQKLIFERHSLFKSLWVLYTPKRRVSVINIKSIITHKEAMWQTFVVFYLVFRDCGFVGWLSYCILTVTGTGAASVRSNIKTHIKGILCPKNIYSSSCHFFIHKGKILHPGFLHVV